MSGAIEKVLVYLDGTEGSLTAAQYAICLCRDSGRQLTALYVVNSRALQDLLKSRIFLEDEQKEYQRELEEDAQRYLNHVREMARQKGLVIETKKTGGTVHQEIKKAVLEGGFDLLVLGELAHIRSRRDAFYDESERAMRNVPCSVLIVKDEERVTDMFEAGD